MHDPFHLLAATRRAPAALGLALCATGLGCAGPAWADYETRRAVEAAAADDSFPSAAEVGLAEESGDSAPDES